MRVLIGLIAGVILGFLLGGLGPRRELAEREALLASLQKKLEAAEKKASRSRPGFLPLPDIEVLDRDQDEADDEDVARADDGDGVEVESSTSPPPAPPRSSPEEEMKQFDLAVDAQRARAKQSRAALQEQAGLEDEEMAEFDNIVADMNEALAVYAEDVLTWAEQEPDTREALGVAHEVTGILYESQTALEELVGEEALPDVDEPSRQIWNYVDLETFRPAVEEQISGQNSPGRR